MIFSMENPRPSVRKDKAPESKSSCHEPRTFPIPLILFTSYIAAEKSDELIKIFCMELPSILKNIHSCKKALEKRTKSVSKLKEEIKEDLKKLKLANIVLKELYDEEECHKAEKEKELQLLHSQIASCENSKNILKNFIKQYSLSKQVLDSLAVQSSHYENAQALIQSYLILQALNEKLIREEIQCTYIFKTTGKEKAELEQSLIKQKYELMAHEKRLEKLINDLQSLKNINYNLNYRMSNYFNQQRENHLDWLQIKRWAHDVCKKITFYKENPLSTEDFLKLLNEIEEFIIFSKEIFLRLEISSESKTK